MPIYVRNPEELEVIQYTGEPNNIEAVIRWLNSRGADAGTTLYDDRRILVVTVDGFAPIYAHQGDYLCVFNTGRLGIQTRAHFEKHYTLKNAGCHNPECPYCETGATALPSPVSAMDVVERG